MLGLASAVRILLFSQPADMRKGFDGLSGLVLAAGEDVYSGHLFVFVSRRRDRAKILAFQKGGLVLWQKRLDRGSFKIRVASGLDRVELDATELTMLIDGIDIAGIRRPTHWKPSAA